MEGTIYVWPVFGEDNFVPRAFPFENGRGEAPQPFSDEKALRTKL